RPPGVVLASHVRRHRFIVPPTPAKTTHKRDPMGSGFRELLPMGRGLMDTIGARTGLRGDPQADAVSWHHSSTSYGAEYSCDPKVTPVVFCIGYARSVCQHWDLLDPVMRPRPAEQQSDASESESTNTS
ncbi:hypothetical protein PGT21_016499, partial [Puccinia graminis f. sp. tritici]